jgi:hypothetical protein
MPPRIIESPWIQKIVNSAVWSSQCSNIKVIPLGKAERIMQELLTEKDKEKEEAVAEAKEELLARIQEWNQDRIEEWVKTCLTETFDNGRFWEAKETQGFLKALEESLTPDQLNNEREV